MDRESDNPRESPGRGDSAGSHSCFTFSASSNALSVWAVFLLIYLLIAAVFPRPVQACIDELTRRPATSFLMGLLSKLQPEIIAATLKVRKSVVEFEVGKKRVART